MAGHGPPKKAHKSVDDYEDELPPPPDGGWGWMVVFASFMIHVVNDGITYSFGIFFDIFVDEFGESKQATSWVLSMLVGMTLCSGPLASVLTNRYGCRIVTIAGAIIASICIIASMWAKAVFTLYFTVGIGTGLGFGLIYLPAIVCVTMWFENKRSLATGIAVCGSGFGTVVFAPLINFMIKEYGWRGSMLVLAGAVLECIIFGALFRPIEKLKPLEDKKSKQPVTAENGTSGKPKTTTEKLSQSHPLLSRSGYSISSGVSKASTKSKGSMARPDIFYQRSLQNIRLTDTEMRKESPFGSKRHYVEDSEREDKMICGCIPWEAQTKKFLKNMLDVSLFKDPLFLLFLLSNFLTSIGFNIPYVFIVPHAKQIGVTEDWAAYLLSVIGIANTIGRIILGYLSDRTWVNRLYIYIVCLVFCGFGVCGVVLYTDYNYLASMMALYGFCIGAYVGLTSVILVDLLGLEKLTNAFGLVLLFQGIASFIGPPIGGVLGDITGNYNPAFLLAGVSLSLSGLILVAIPPIQRYQKVKAQNLAITRSEM